MSENTGEIRLRLAKTEVGTTKKILQADSMNLGLGIQSRAARRHRCVQLQMSWKQTRPSCVDMCSAEVLAPQRCRFFYRVGQKRRLALCLALQSFARNAHE